MSRLINRLTTAAMIAAGFAAAQGVANADPPPPPPFVPGPPLTGFPGAYTYSPYMQLVYPPAVTDARGVQIGTNADPAQSNIGLPGSKLGHNPPRFNAWGVNGNVRSGIKAGLTPAQPTPGSVNSLAGHQQLAPAEDPSGQPSSSDQAPPVPMGLESSLPAAGPFGAYAPLLENPDGQSQGASAGPIG